MRTLSGFFRTTAAAALVASTAAFATVVAAPAPAEAETVLRVVKHSSLRVLDPILTTAYMSRNHGYMVFDTLFATDENFEVKPQMVDTWDVSDDGLTYTFTLRDGLMWHDGEPVTAADCVASIKRWGTRDTMGQKLMDFVKAFEEVDDKTFRLVLSEPYGLVIESLGKVSSNVPFMMPKRLAETPGTEAIKEQIGSGPFKFVHEEFQPGVKAVYVRNPDYAPRDEPSSWATGAKIVKVDRVEWLSMPDHMTAVNALVGGEIDIMESAPHDLYPILAASPDVEMRVINHLGLQGMLRFNHLHPPFDNPTIRRAVAYAINQEDYMASWVGNPDFYRTCPAMFVCETPLAADVGADGLMQGNQDRARELLKEGGYDGTPIVILQPTDVASIASYPVVTAQALRQVGMTVDLQAMDWQTLVSRRAVKGPPAEGGWNIFHTNWASVDVMNPISNAGTNAGGAERGWFGWPGDEEVERLRDAFAKETDADKQRDLAFAVQERAYEVLTHLPLGEYTANFSHRTNISGVLDSPVPFFWNIEKK